MLVLLLLLRVHLLLPVLLRLRRLLLLQLAQRPLRQLLPLPAQPLAVRP